MLSCRRIARNFLRDSTLTSFWDVVREAKISDYDQEILEAKFVKGKSVVEISIEYGYSVEKVKAVISSGYDKVYRALEEGRCKT